MILKQSVRFPVPPSPKFRNTWRKPGSAEGIILLPDGFDADGFDALLSEAGQRYAFSWHDPESQAVARNAARGKAAQA